MNVVVLMDRHADYIEEFDKMRSDKNHPNHGEMGKVSEFVRMLGNAEPVALHSASPRYPGYYNSHVKNPNVAVGEPSSANRKGDCVVIWRVSKEVTLSVSDLPKVTKLVKLGNSKKIGQSLVNRAKNLGCRDEDDVIFRIIELRDLGTHDKLRLYPGARKKKMVKREGLEANPPMDRFTQAVFDAMEDYGIVGPGYRIEIDSKEIIGNSDWANVGVYVFSPRKRKPTLYWNLKINIVRDQIHWDRSTAYAL